MRPRLSLFLAVFFLASTLTCLADVLYLHGGKQIEGTFLRGDPRTVRFLTNDGQIKTFPIANIESLTFGGEASAASVPPTSAPQTGFTSAANPPFESALVPKGTVLIIRTIDSVDSDKNNPGETFRATLDEPLEMNGRTLAPKGALVSMQLVHVKQSGQLRGEEEIALQLSSITLNNKTYPVTTRFADLASEGKGGQTAKVVSGTAVAGAVIGAITGGKKGAAVGAAAGAGTGVAIQTLRGKRVRVPSETRLAFTLDENLSLE